MYYLAILMVFSFAFVDCQRPFGGRRPFGGGSPFGGGRRPFGGGQARPNGGQGRPFGGFGGGRPGAGSDATAATGGRPFRPPFRPPFGRPPFGGPGGDRALLRTCTIVPGLKDPRAFLRVCLADNSEAANRCEIECGEGQACCPTNIPDGICRWKCQATVDPKPKAGQCPAAADDTDGAGGTGSAGDAGSTGLFPRAGAGPGGRGPGGRGPRWIRGFCDFAIKSDLASPIACRHDGDCTGSQKCCSPAPNPGNIFDMCKRECVTV